jgi:5'-nucleotidase
MKNLLSLVLGLLLLAGCTAPRTVSFLQINDVYEIAPLNNGKEGGMARVAQVYKELKAQNPHTYFVLAGDFISPSVVGTLRQDGKRIQGKHMIEVLNAAGLDYATFGNHEFDYDDPAPTVLQERLDESDFAWVIGNIRQRVGSETRPLMRRGVPLPTTVLLESGRIKIGLLAVCIPVNKDYLEITDPLETARRDYAALKDKADAVVALTHIDKADDRRLAQQVPDLGLIMGGHDHDNMIERVGKVVVAKADANAKTVYVHKLHFDRKKKLREVESTLLTIDDTLPEDPATRAVVDKWQQIATESFRQLGFEPNEVVYTTREPWDGREKTVRTEHGALTSAIAASMFEAFEGNELAVFNGGSVRVDDVLEGPVSQYDIVRILPFGGGISQVRMTGELLHKVLEAGRLNRGKGGFLHHHSASYEPEAKRWRIGTEPLDPSRSYQVTLPDFLLTGKEFGMSFLVADHPGILARTQPESTALQADIRKVFIRYLKNQKP